MSTSNKIILAVLSAAIAAGICAVVWLALTPNPADRFTEFYILNKDGQAANYPAEIKAGDPVVLIAGVVNHEGKPASYSISIVSRSNKIQTVETGNLNSGQKWENKISFTLNEPGKGQKVEFYLYMDGGDQPRIKDPLVLIINVTGK